MKISGLFPSAVLLLASVLTANSIPIDKDQSPAPINSTSPAPTSSTSPAPSNSTIPVPSNSAIPAPTNNTTTVPRNSTYTILKACKKKGYAALTFESGPGKYTADLLEKLDELGVNATFFIRGDQVANNSALLSNITEMGHQLAIHAWSDVDFEQLSDSDIRSQISNTSDIIFQYAGVRPRYVRASESQCGEENCLPIMQELGLIATDVNVDTNDGKYNKKSADKSKAKQDILNLLKNKNKGWPSLIVLQHEYQFTIEQLVDYVYEAASKYKFVTLAECIGQPAYLDDSTATITATATYNSTATATVLASPTGLSSATVTTNAAAQSTTTQKVSAAGGAVQVAAWTLALSAVIAFAMV